MFKCKRKHSKTEPKPEIGTVEYRAHDVSLKLNVSRVTVRYQGEFPVGYCLSVNGPINGAQVKALNNSPYTITVYDTSGDPVISSAARSREGWLNDARFATTVSCEQEITFAKC